MTEKGFAGQISFAKMINVNARKMRRRFVKEKFRVWNKQRLEKKVKAQLYREIRKNLEISYVMAQRGDFLSFLLDKWKQAQEDYRLCSDEQLQQYGQRIAKYNEAYFEFVKYQEWYAKDIQHKTYEHAKELHSRVELMEAQRQGLTEVIKTAEAGLRTHLIKDVTSAD
jgi:hypothetical protein